MNPDLVVRDKEGKPYSVRYDAVNAMLLNEFLKEHRKGSRNKKRLSRASRSKLKRLPWAYSKVNAQLIRAAKLCESLNAATEQIEAKQTKAVPEHLKNKHFPVNPKKLGHFSALKLLGLFAPVVHS